MYKGAKLLRLGVSFDWVPSCSSLSLVTAESSSCGTAGLSDSWQQAQQLSLPPLPEMLVDEDGCDTLSGIRHSYR